MPKQKANGIRKPGNKPVSLVYTPEDQALVAALQAKLGVDNTALVRLALRRLAEHEQVKVA